MTVSIENFVKVIYRQCHTSDADAKLSTIAALLHISNAAATDMAKKLAHKGLVNYLKYKPLTLTPTGTDLALNVIRKHRLWEAFLHQTLDLSLYEIHREAEILEHQTSDFLADKIEAFLGNPTTDPHGDPIPNIDGTFDKHDTQILLAKAEEGKKYRISRLYSIDKSFFDFCNDNFITIGTDVWVQKQYSAQKMTEIIIKQKKIVLNSHFANIIYVSN